MLVWMKFGIDVVEVIDQLHAKCYFLKLSLTRYSVTGSKKNRSSSESCALSFDHFFPSEPFYTESFWICMKIGTHIVEVID